MGFSGEESPVVDALVDGTAANSGKLAGGGTGVRRGGEGGGKGSEGMLLYSAPSASSLKDLILSTFSSAMR